MPSARERKRAPRTLTHALALLPTHRNPAKMTSPGNHHTELPTADPEYSLLNRENLHLFSDAGFDMDKM